MKPITSAIEPQQAAPGQGVQDGHDDDQHGHQQHDEVVELQMARLTTTATTGGQRFSAGRLNGPGALVVGVLIASLLGGQRVITR